jgi:hypothetical protein
MLIDHNIPDRSDSGATFLVSPLQYQIAHLELYIQVETGGSEIEQAQ